jgi:hypothetical protein
VTPPLPAKKNHVKKIAGRHGKKIFPPVHGRQALMWESNKVTGSLRIRKEREKKRKPTDQGTLREKKKGEITRPHTPSSALQLSP